MGYSKKDKAESHERIVRVAASRFRETGVNGIGVADLMKEVGLTHGGFYRHFASRDDLVGEAVEHALQESGKAATEMLANSSLGKPELLAVLIDAYLGLPHRDELGASCAVTTLAADVARSTDRARAAYARQVETYLALFVELIGDGPLEVRRQAAIAAWSTLVGAVSMARAVDDEALSREILASTAAELKARLGLPPRRG